VGPELCRTVLGSKLYRKNIQHKWLLIIVDLDKQRGDDLYTV
jgi:hypothetical protein